MRAFFISTVMALDPVEELQNLRVGSYDEGGGGQALQYRELYFTYSCISNVRCN